MNKCAAEKTMTVKEVADALNVNPETIKVWVRKLYPELLRNGITTYLTEYQATVIKQSIGTGRNDLQNVLQVKTVFTDAEMFSRIYEVEQWLKSKVNQLQKENCELNKTVNILTHVNKTYTATEIAKEMNMKSANELNKWLAVEVVVEKFQFLDRVQSQNGIHSSEQRNIRGMDFKVRPFKSFFGARQKRGGIFPCQNQRIQEVKSSLHIS